MLAENLTEERIKEYTRVAYYYYKAGFTQDQIAKKMQMSRQRVNRVLGECIEIGIVQITIADLNKSYLELEAKLEEKYQLKAVRIVENVIEEKIHEELGIMAGKYLKSIINKGDVIGFSRGRATAALVNHMPQIQKADFTVTQLIGSENKEIDHTGVNDIVYRFSEKLQAKPSMLYAPVIVQNEELKNSIVKDPFFLNAYEIIKSCNIAIVGIGTASSQGPHMAELYNSSQENDYAWLKDAAGEICTHFFNNKGDIIIPPFRNRIIAIELEDYLKIPVRIGVAGLTSKAEAIRAAIIGNYINVLITDLETAKLLI